MELREIDFGNAFGASGVQGFFGEGYPFHKVWKYFGLNFTGMTFVAKTATLLAREGNMPLTASYVPHDLFPTCVKIKPWRGLMLNAVGLSNPGLAVLLKTGQWQKRTEPFFISLMSVASTLQARLQEFRIMVDMVGSSHFSASFGLQINLSCPNTGHNSHELMRESLQVLEIVSTLGVPIMPKYSIASAPIEAVLELQDHPVCDAICVSNSLPFGWQGVDWKRVWGSVTSPLAALGGGGLSGKILRPLVCRWITRLRDAGFLKPINGGGGILCPNDVECYNTAGASSVFLGSVALLRPWRVSAIIRQANSLNWK